MTVPHLHYSRRPSALRYMAGAFAIGRPGLAGAGRFPPLVATWRGVRLGERERAQVRALAGPEPGPGLDLLLPQLVGLRLQMAVLTHRSFPLPIWRALQVRNRLHLLRPIPEGVDLALETHVDQQRLLEKGAEVDLHTRARAGGELCWEGIATYYYRGQLGGSAAPPAQAPAVEAPPQARWPAPAGVGWRAGHLTGDYNPLHWWRGYARRSGFRGPFLHPPLALVQCLARLPAPPAGEGQRLDAWMKGPVYEGAAVSLCAEPEPGGSRFALAVEGDERPALVGRWRAARLGETLDAEGSAAAR